MIKKQIIEIMKNIQIKRKNKKLLPLDEIGHNNEQSR